MILILPSVCMSQQELPSQLYMYVCGVYSLILHADLQTTHCLLERRHSEMVPSVPPDGVMLSISWPTVRFMVVAIDDGS